MPRFDTMGLRTDTVEEMRHAIADYRADYAAGRPAVEPRLYVNASHGHGKADLTALLRLHATCIDKHIRLRITE
jgi:hypothetical protein